MPINQRNAGFISTTYQPLQVANAPTIGAATAGDASASVAFTAPANVGGSAISAYYAVSNPDRVTVSGASSPITVTGLTNGTAYTFSVWALNTYGPSPFSGASGSVTPAVPPIGLFGGGYGAANYNIIDKIIISTTGNATDFGDLLKNTIEFGACGSSTRGVWAGGNSKTVDMEYNTFSTAGNSLDFGDLLYPARFQGGCNSATRGIFGGGASTSYGDNSNLIEYITIASTGNSVFFGELTVGANELAACSSPTRGVFGGGVDSGNQDLNVISYITISSTGNATDFGDLTVARKALAACSSSTRGLFIGGQTLGSTIDYITIATTGNATDFGDLTLATYALAACSSSTRATIGGGRNTNYTNIIEFVTIATTSNATDFGDLTTARRNLAACSSSNGGVQ